MIYKIPSDISAMPRQEIEETLVSALVLLNIRKNVIERMRREHITFCGALCALWAAQAVLMIIKHYGG